MIELVDCSGFQPTTIDWKKVAGAGISGVIVKATDGLGSPDPHFGAHCAGAKSAGLLRSAYHFLRVRHGRPQDAVAQADEFCDAYLAQGCELIPALDCEDGGKDTENTKATPDEWLAAIRAFIATTVARVGCRPMIYSYPWWWRSLGETVAQADDLALCPLWIADYAGHTTPIVLRPWTDWVLWQFSEASTVAGIPGHVDQSSSREPLSELVRDTSASAAVQTARDERGVTGPLVGEPPVV